MAKGSARYWEMRRARQMHAELVPVEEAADELTEIYLKASKDLEEQAAKLVDIFATNNRLSRTEARRMLSRIMDPSDIRQIIQELSLDPKNADLVAELESQAYGARLRRLQEAQAAADEAAAKILTRSGTIFDKTLAGVIRKTHADQIFDLHKRAGFAFPYTPVSDQRIEQILRMPWHGANYSQNLWGNTQDLARRVKQEMVESLLTGKSNERMRQGIQEQFGAKASDARRLIRTEAAYVSGEIQRQTYEDLGVKKYIYVAILDSRTSEICQRLDGKSFPVAEARAGDPLHPYPPMHPYCRSTTIADLPKDLLHDLERNAVDPETGDLMQVPMDMTYEEWDKTYGPASKKKKGATV